MGIKFGLDSLAVIEIAKDFASHVSLPKKGFIEYVECVKAISVVPQITTEKLCLPCTNLHGKGPYMHSKGFAVRCHTAKVTR
jgi:hypothetical protein